METKHKVQLGLGLIGIGREWGHVPKPVPDEETVLDFLEFARRLGITFFDTAASYGASEERLGKFLKGLRPQERTALTISTKFGDHWDRQRQTAYPDHSYEALCRSFDRSLSLLGRIDVLQLHKTTPEALKSRGVQRALAHAQLCGVKVFGASVSDLTSGRLVCADHFYQYIQFPYNAANRSFEELFAAATASGIRVLVNRPFQMGALFGTDTPQLTESRAINAFRDILKNDFEGRVLTGTRSKEHLAENWRAFQAALKEERGP